MEIIPLGSMLTCHETGKAFTAARDGCSVNYARDGKGYVYSDEGVDVREKRELLDRSRPFFAYVSSDGKHVTGWKGNILGRITWSTTHRTGFGGSKLLYINVVDVHGGKWHGKGAGRGMCITLRPSKT